MPPAFNNKRAKKGLHLEPKYSRWSLLCTTTRPLRPTPFKYAVQSVPVVRDQPRYAFLSSVKCEDPRSSSRQDFHSGSGAAVLHSPVYSSSVTLRSPFPKGLPRSKQGSGALSSLLRDLLFRHGFSWGPCRASDLPKLIGPTLSHRIWYVNDGIIAGLKKVILQTRT